MGDGGPGEQVARLLVAYDGSAFAGWAPQPGQRTVAAALAAALRTVLRLPSGPELVVAGRTDAGVHALGQVVSYPGRTPRLRSVNALLPDAVAVRAAGVAPPGFSARASAVARAYRYRVLAAGTPTPFERGRSLWWPHRLDVDALHACARALVGEHDFTAFTPTDSYHQRFTRVVGAAAWAWEAPSPGGVGRPASSPRGAAPPADPGGGVLGFRIEADAFMRQMNRVLVGTMLEVAGGRRSLESFVALLEGAPRAAAGVTAPPHGLYLEAVRYPDGWPLTAS